MGRLHIYVKQKNQCVVNGTIRFCNVQPYSGSALKIHLGSRQLPRALLRQTIVIRNGKIVWKHGPFLAEF